MFISIQRARTVVHIMETKLSCANVACAPLAKLQDLTTATQQKPTKQQKQRRSPAITLHSHTNIMFSLLRVGVGGWAKTNKCEL